jgi:DNA-directed RNA polymerase subunit RPC12/RpoP
MKRKRFHSPADRGGSRSKNERRWSSRSGGFPSEENFQCLHCGAQVSTNPRFAGVQNRNHCPYCLYSRHVDLTTAGDRLCGCKAPMRPVGLTIKQTHKKYAREDSGELMLIHTCEGCASLSINRIAADDLADVILAIFEESLHMDDSLKERVSSQGIRLLVEADRRLVEIRLFGRKDPSSEMDVTD